MTSVEQVINAPTLVDARRRADAIRGHIQDINDTAAAEVVSLPAIATSVREALDRYRKAEEVAYEAQIEVGHLLAAARHALPSDVAYGEWFRAQDFGFSQQWSSTLRRAAEHEAEVRLEVTSQLVTGAKANIEKALRAVRPPRPRPDRREPDLTGGGRKIIESLDEQSEARETLLATTGMSVDEVKAMVKVGSATDAEFDLVMNAGPKMTTEYRIQYRRYRNGGRTFKVVTSRKKLTQALTDIRRREVFDLKVDERQVSPWSTSSEGGTP